jgi:hypothetical protein
MGLNVLEVRYEEVRHNPAAELARIFEFLGLDSTPTSRTEIVVQVDNATKQGRSEGLVFAGRSAALDADLRSEPAGFRTTSPVPLADWEVELIRRRARREVEATGYMDSSWPRASWKTVIAGRRATTTAALEATVKRAQSYVRRHHATRERIGRAP